MKSVVPAAGQAVRPVWMSLRLTHHDNDNTITRSFDRRLGDHPHWHRSRMDGLLDLDLRQNARRTRRLMSELRTTRPNQTLSLKR